MGTGKRRSRSQRARDKRRTADLYLQGWLQSAIAEEMHLSTATICRDLKTLQAEWVESALVDFDAKKAQELAKIDRLEREYWQEWQLSKKVETSFGDPRYLTGVQWCIGKRCKLLGFDAPTKIAPTDPTGRESYDLINSDLQREILGRLLRINAEGDTGEVDE